jgi:hypothetical protein
MFARAADFILSNNGIFCTVAIPPRDQLGRFLGELPGYDDDEYCADSVGSVYALVAETVTADLDEETSEDDDEEGSDSFIDDIFGWGLSPEEWDEMNELNEKHETEYYRPEDLMTLRRLDGLRWIEETYGKYMDPVVTAVKAGTSGSSGFGSGEKYSLNNWDWIHGRRGHDDGRKKRKAMFNRQLRENRHMRVINITA